MPPTIIGWTEADQSSANQDGWIPDTDLKGNLVIARVGSAARFDSDSAATAYVGLRAALGDLFAKKAFEALAHFHAVEGAAEAGLSRDSVIVGVYSHRHGRDINVYRTNEAAEAARRDLASEWWSEVFPDAEIPSDRKEAADCYFERAAELTDESFETIDAEIQ